jgi:hypothetical protein
MVINGLRSPKKLPRPWQPIPLRHSNEKKSVVGKTVVRPRAGRAGTVRMMERILPRDDCGVKQKDYKILW